MIRVNKKGLPTGIILPYGGATAPSGWLLCDGTSYLRADYPNLFAIIGVLFGSADGTHFNIPDMRGNMPIGKKSTDSDFDTIGKTYGEKTHTLIIAEMPAHAHAYGGNESGAGPEAGGTGHGLTSIYPTDSKGGDGAHNNMPPVVVINYIIKI
jgi:microcystin-dependent protein